MNVMTASEVAQFVLERLKQKDHRRLWPMAPRLLELIHNAHEKYISSLNEEVCYDEDDAFEAVYSECLNALPQESDDDMALAALINAYFEVLDDLE